MVSEAIPRNQTKQYGSLDEFSWRGKTDNHNPPRAGSGNGEGERVCGRRPSLTAGVAVMGEAAIAGQQHDFQLLGLKDLTIDTTSSAKSLK